jgi:hypothetical protein
LKPEGKREERREEGRGKRERGRGKREEGRRKREEGIIRKKQRRHTGYKDHRPQTRRDYTAFLQG